MVKEPKPGLVKTRLGKSIGMTRAAWWFRHNANDLIRNLSSENLWTTILAVSPDKEGLSSRVWPNGLRRWPQGAGNLGLKMANIFKNAKKGPVVIIGSDIPRIKTRYIKAAFDALGDHDAVVGPSYDGGYWLIGMKRGAKSIPCTIFQNVRWSTPNALSDTIKSFEGLKVKQIIKLQDIDTVEDFKRLDQKIFSNKSQ